MFPQLMLPNKGFATLITHKVSLSNMVFLMVTELSTSSKYFITLVTGKILHVSVLDMSFQTPLVKIDFPTDITRHPEGGMSFFKVRSDVNNISCYFFKTYST